ncbi:MAG: c-type cytochrome, partial [Steroidobacteraceae bacterium]
MLRRCAAFTLLAAFVPVAGAQAPGRIDVGHKLFQKNCSACHGSEAKGGRGPDLTTGHRKYGSSDA